MTGNRRSQASSAEGFVVILGLAAVVGVVTLIVKFIWVILGLLVFAASIFLARTLLKENRERDAEYSAYCVAVASRADQQDEWVVQGDDRGIYGPHATELKHLLDSGGNHVTADYSFGTPEIQAPSPVSRARRSAPALVVVAGIATLAFLSSIGTPEPRRAPQTPTIEPTRSPISNSVTTSIPTPTATTPTWPGTATVTTTPYGPPTTPERAPTYPPTLTSEPTTPYLPAAPPKQTPVYAPAPEPGPFAPPGRSAPYSSCREAAADGRFNIPADDPAYGRKLDPDHDGIACEP